MKYKLLVFDFDGTLADSEVSIMESLRLVAEDFGLSGVDKENARRSIGLSLQHTIEVGLGLEPRQVPEAVELYRKHYNEVAFGLTCLFPGVKETLDLLRQDFLLAVASSKSKYGLVAMMRHLGIFERFSFIAGAQDVQQGKPAPDMVLLALEALNVLAGESLVIGDTIYDIEMGQRAGADTCAVTYGNNSTEELRSLNPTFLIDSFESVVSLVQA
ncbi:HAD family hydrolase [Prosthecochloris sp.]|uniref:HAD family hydrolase n=1 Tax=Prosthecochloris sp. TaxID=290513 RepID=UPI00257EDB38|nr:HAD family hydrolase [Prosthecochloris sp.]